MPRWLDLTIAEAKRARRLGALMRRQPVLATALVCGLASVLWLSARGGDAAAAAVPATPDGLAVLAAAATIPGLLFGFATSQLAPRLGHADAQLRLAPLPAAQSFFGATAAPLIAMWTVSSAPLVVFTVRAYAGLGLAHVWAWGLVACAAYLSAAASAAVIAEVIRALSAAAARGRVLPALACGQSSLGLGVVVARGASAPWWLGAATLLPGANAGGLATPSLALAFPLAWLCFTSGVSAWVWIGAGAHHRRRAPVVRAALPARCASRHALLAWWLVSPIVRERGLTFVALAPLPMSLAAMIAARSLGAVGQLYLAFAPIGAVAAGAQLVMMLSERLHAAGWCWQLVPVRRFVPGLWWWSGASALAAFVSLPGIAPLLLGRDLDFSAALAWTALGAVGGSVVGRLVPWDSRSQVQQFAGTVLFFAVFMLGLYALDWLRERSSLAVGSVAVSAMAIAATAAVSMYFPWGRAWRTS